MMLSVGRLTPFPHPPTIDANYACLLFGRPRNLVNLGRWRLVHVWRKCHSRFQKAASLLAIEQRDEDCEMLSIAQASEKEAGVIFPKSLASFTSHAGTKGRKQLRDGAASDVPAGRVPRIARLMALAIRCDQLIRHGIVANQSALADFGHVTMALMTQIIVLLSLAPDIQVQVLFRPRTQQGRDAIEETEVRPIAALLCRGLACCGPFGAKKPKAQVRGRLPSLLKHNQLPNKQGGLNRERESSNAILRTGGSSPRLWYSATENREPQAGSRIIAKCCEHCG